MTKSRKAATCRRIRLRAAAPLAVMGTSLLLASCSGDKPLPVYPVTGKVTFGKQVPAGAQIVLHPDGHSLPGDAIPTGRVADDGTFQMGTYDRADGAPAGEYKATVQWFKVVSGAGGSGPGPNVLPPTYADPAKTPIRVAIKEGTNDLPPIVIK